MDKVSLYFLSFVVEKETHRQLLVLLLLMRHTFTLATIYYLSTGGIHRINQHSHNSTSPKALFETPLVVRVKGNYDDIHFIQVENNDPLNRALYPLYYL